MTILQDIEEKIKTAIKEQDKVKLNVFRDIKTKLVEYENSSLRKSQTPNKTIDSDIFIKILHSMVKQRKDSVESFLNCNRRDLASIETTEALILEELLPKQMTDEELRNYVEEVALLENPSSMKDMGNMIKKVLSGVNGRSDGKRVSIFVKQYIESLSNRA